MDKKEIRLAHNAMLPKWGNRDYQSTRFMLALMGLLSVVVGFLTIPDEVQGIGDWIIQGLMIVSGLYFLFCSIFWMTANSKYAPSVVMDDEEFKIRHNFFEPIKTFKWGNIDRMSVKEDQIEIDSPKGHEVIPLEPKCVNSSELKESLQQFCKEKSVDFIS